MTTDDSRHRTHSARKILDDFLRRTTTPDADDPAPPEDSANPERLFDTHPDLRPELEIEIRKLRLVRRAVTVAHTDPETLFPGYRIRNMIHSGGQGVVYRARQDGTDRDVAIKVIREGPFSGPNEAARFEREVHVLAQLRHPNIIAIHESGTASGHLYFVMDYVDGESLDDYVQRTTPDIRTLIRLFIQICGAVHAAHLRGIIHRDLKPSNIRVDRNGTAHVLDFGLAKIQWDGSADLTITGPGHFVGSLPWASPEQIEQSSADIDIRTDVYSLGAVLYQLLTGRLPHDMDGPMHEVMDRIVNCDPVRPRSTARTIDVELESILLECLHKQRHQRYQSAADLARDLERYCNGERVEARRGHRWYSVRKTIRRHRLPLTIGAAFVILVTAFGASMWDQAIRAQDAEQHAISETAAANRMREFIVDHVHQLGGVGVDRPGSAFDESAQLLAAELDPYPELQSSFLRTIARLYQSRDLAIMAVPWRERVVALHRRPGGDSARIAETLLDLGVAHHLCGSNEAALDALNEGLELERSADLRSRILHQLGVVLGARGSFDSARNRLQEALALRRAHHPDPAALAGILRDQGRIEHELGFIDAADAALRESIELFRTLGQPREVARGQRARGRLLQERGEYAEAEASLRQALSTLHQLGGDENAETAGLYLDLGWAVRERHEAIGIDARAHASSIVRHGRSLRRAHHPDDELGRAEADYMLALAYSGTGRGFLDAELYAKEALQVYDALLGSDHPRTADVQCRYGQILVEGHVAAGTSMGNRLGHALGIPRDPSPAALARPLLENAVRVRERTYPANHWKVAEARSLLGACRLAMGEVEAGAALVVAAHPILENARGSGHHMARASLGRLVLVDILRDDAPDGRSRFAELLERDDLLSSHVITHDDGSREAQFQIDYLDDFAVKTIDVDAPTDTIESAQLWFLGRPFNLAGSSFSSAKTHRLVVNTGAGPNGTPAGSIAFSPALIFGFIPEVWHWTSIQVPPEWLRQGANTFEIMEQGTDSSWEVDNLFLGIDTTSDSDHSAWYSDAHAPRSPEACAGELMIRLQLVFAPGSPSPRGADASGDGWPRISPRINLGLLLNRVGVSLLIEGFAAEAERVQRFAQEIHPHPKHRNDLAACLIGSMPFAEVEPMLTGSLDALVDRYGAGHRYSWVALDRLIALYEHHARTDLANDIRRRIRDILVEGYESDRARMGPDSHGAQSYITPLIQLCQSMGDELEANRWKSRQTAP